MTKKLSIPSLTTAAKSGKFLYFVWTGPRSAIIEWAHSDEGKETLHPLLHTGNVARIWCPGDGDSIVTLKMQNVGTIVSS